MKIHLCHNERTHAFWCANLLPYPMTRKSFHDLLERNAIDWTDSAYVATEDNGQATGFFCYSVNTTDNTGFLKFVIVDKMSLNLSIRGEKNCELILFL